MFSQLSACYLCPQSTITNKSTICPIVHVYYYQMGWVTLNWQSAQCMFQVSKTTHYTQRWFVNFGTDLIPLLLPVTQGIYCNCLTSHGPCIHAVLHACKMLNGIESIDIQHKLIQDWTELWHNKRASLYIGACMCACSLRVGQSTQ